MTRSRAKPRKIDADKIGVMSTWVSPGVLAFTAFCWDDGFVLGTVWATAVGKDQVAIQYSFVRPCYRRQGVRMAIHEYMATHYTKIITEYADCKAAERFLAKAGFQHDKKTGEYRWTKGRGRK